MGLASVLSIDDAHRAARRSLPKSLSDFVDGGAEDERTISRNRQAFTDVLLRPRAATAVAQPDLRTTVMGVAVSMPVVLAPCGQLRLIHPDGDLAASAAARVAGTTSIISSGSGHTVEDIAAVAPAEHGFFQLYKLGGRAGAQQLLERAKAAGYRGIVVTVDTPINGNRERDRRNGYTKGIQVDLRNAVRYGPGLARRPAWLYRFVRGGLVIELANVVDEARQRGVSAGDMPELLRASPFDWADVQWLRDLWPDGPMAVKGILTGDDARRAVDCGADAVVVSNHGGRQLDSEPGTLDVLPEVVAAVDSAIEVLVDGGVRRGTDVVKALALGARAVLIGRPYIWGLAIGGQPGVEHILDILRSEIERTMILLGCPSLAEIDASLLMRLPRR